MISAAFLILNSAGIQLPSWLNSEFAIGILSVLTLVGVVSDPTTRGLDDSALAMSRQTVDDNIVYPVKKEDGEKSEIFYLSVNEDKNKKNK